MERNGFPEADDYRVFLDEIETDFKKNFVGAEGSQYWADLEHIHGLLDGTKNNKRSNLNAGVKREIKREILRWNGFPSEIELDCLGKVR